MLDGRGDYCRRLDHSMVGCCVRVILFTSFALLAIPRDGAQPFVAARRSG